MSTDSAAILDPLSLVDAGPLGPLPRLSGRAVRLRDALEHSRLGARLEASLRWLSEPLGDSIEVGSMEVHDGPSGLQRAGVVARLSSARHSTRLACGLEAPLAHALVDRLLGFERFSGEEQLQVTPVEWGILGCLLARALGDFTSTPAAPDVVVDRIGAGPFSTEGFGAMVTLRWPVRIGTVRGSARLWVPEGVLRAWADAIDTVEPVADLQSLHPACPSLVGVWRAEAGHVSLSRGIGRLRVGSVQPIDGAPLRGTVASPTGIVTLSLRDREGRCHLATECVPLSAGGRLVVLGPLRRDVLPREAIAVTTPSSPDSNPARDRGSSSAPDARSGAIETIPPTEVPVTLTVELGRISLPVQRVAELKPGDVLELARHAREPVELTSGGKLVARGELVQIDTELGVRVTNVFL